MPLTLPHTAPGLKWQSTPVDNPLLQAKWDRVKDEHLSRNYQAYGEATAMGMANGMMFYAGESAGKDEWQTPKETIDRGRGDCEDWAILVRSLLINGNYDPKDLWLLIVEDLAIRRPHALLWTLNCFLDHRSRTPLLHNRFLDYRPVIAFNDKETVSFGAKSI